MDANTQMASDIHFLTAPLRFLLRSLLWLVFLLCAPALFLIVPILAVKYASPDEICMLKWVFGVLGPFASAFWFVIIAMIPAHKRGERGLGFHLKSFGATAFGFLASAAAMFFFATNYGVCYNWDDSAWFTGAWLALLSPFAFLCFWRLVKRAIFGRD